ncbi:hypothetical protein [Tropicibacter oceani]|uniref:Lipopolysaccharide assembly protein A domain-containing protein n=1 Tax=Tropicibacter oceani TaxID=3058420 RepID=A0ABY8QI20_9RHOB|nr:hypothetical protein [Tropicibacter oceani]WGW03432.1 hypothetical protein QF118_16110 [Tropicibacter oceani]
MLEDTALWVTILGLPVAILSAYFGWKALRSRKSDTTNIATGSKRVRQSGGKGQTYNHAENSEDVEQSG